MTNPIKVNTDKTITSIIRNGTAIEKMMLAWEWQPQGLFLGDVQAAWYDSINTANDDWRRNLLTWSEDFRNSVWGLAAVDIANPTKVAADEISFPAVVGIGNVSITRQSLTTIAAPYVASVELKAKTAGDVGKRIAIYINDGSITTVFHTLTADYVRVSATKTTAAATSFFSIGVLGSTYGGVNQDACTVNIRNAQLEFGSTATEYQRITDVNTEVFQRFPNTTIFQDSGGAVPSASASAGQTVGMWVDKSKNLEFGPELVVNGNFATDSDWTKLNGATISGGVATLFNAVSNPAIIQTRNFTIGRTYRVSLTWTGTITAGLGAYGSGDMRFITNGTVGSFVGYVTISAGTGASVWMQAPANSAVIVNSVSVKEVFGNHAFQTSTSLRPLFGRAPVSRRNLLLRTEEFENNAWNKLGATITSNTQLAPNGILSADVITATSGSGEKYVRQDVSSTGQRTVSIYAKAGTHQFIQITHLNAGYVANFDLGANQVGTVAANTTAQIEDVGNGWRRCTATFSGSVTYGGNIRVYMIPNATSSYGALLNATGSETIFLWGAQLETGPTATPYQKVVTALDITESGKPSYAFIRPDLSDDKLTTNMASKKNLLRYTEEFDNAAWSKSGLTAVGTLITETAISGFHQLAPVSGNVIANTQHTYSFEVKPSGRSHIHVSWANNGSHYAVFSLSGNGAVLSNQLAGIGTITLLADGYYRITYTNTPTIAGANFYGINLADGAYPTTPVPSYLGDVTKGVFIRNAQLEVGGVATPYEYGGFKGDIVIAGKNGSSYQSNIVSPTGVIDLGPVAYTGGTPGILRAVGDIVGYTMARKKFSDVEKAQLVRYYKKRGAKGILTLGPELITNGDFSNGSTGWTFLPATISNGGVSWTTNVFVTQPSPTLLSLGSRVKVSFDITSYTSGFVYPYIGGAFQDTNQRGNIVGTYEFIVTITNLVNQTIGVASGNSPTHTVDNISIRELRPEEEW